MLRQKKGVEITWVLVNGIRLVRDEKGPFLDRHYVDEVRALSVFGRMVAYSIVYVIRVFV